MNARDAEKLLGGFAAGILTDAEKTLLFSAALAHQELFNALADEEALRELLADPPTRRHLLTLLSGTRTRAAVPFWRRPAVLGLAASLFAMVTTGMVLWQQQAHPAPVIPTTEKTVEGSRVPSASPSKSAPPPPKAAPMAESQARSNEIGGTPRLLAKATPAPPPQPEAEPVHRAEAVAPPASEAKRLTQELPSAVAEVMADAPTSDRHPIAPQGQDKASLTQLPTDRRMVNGAALAPGAASGALDSTRPEGQGLSVPTWTLLPRPPEGFHLIVHSAAGSHLYVLKRTPMGAQVLTPSTATLETVGTIRSVFAFPLAVEDHLDLYLLHHPEPDPKALPATGTVDGFRQRVR